MTGSSPARRARLGVLISGRGSNMTALAEAAAAPGYPAEIALVLSNAPDAAGLEKAAARGLAVACVDHREFRGDKPAFETAMTERLRAAGADLICLAGFMRVLSPTFLAAWPDAILNIHPSLLPAFRGLDTHARALAAGVRFHGASVHVVRADLDDGPILAQAALRVAPGETETALAARVLALEHHLYPAAVAAFAAGVARLEGDRVVWADGDAAAALAIAAL